MWTVQYLQGLRIVQMFAFEQWSVIVLNKSYLAWFIQTQLWQDVRPQGGN